MTFDPVVSAQFWNSRNQAERTALAAAVAEARQEAGRLARLLQEKADAEAVYLFGSLAEGTVYHHGFDIDLALVKGNFQEARRIVLASRFEVDLQEYEALPLPIRQRIDTQGVRLV